MADYAVAFQLFRHERVLRPRLNFDFDYSCSFIDKARSLYSNSQHVCNQFFTRFAALLYSYATTGLSPSAIQGQAVLRLRKQLNESGERFFFVEIALRSFRYFVMLKESNTLMEFDDHTDIFTIRKTTRRSKISATTCRNSATWTNAF